MLVIVPPKALPSPAIEALARLARDQVREAERSDGPEPLGELAKVAVGNILDRRGKTDNLSVLPADQ